MDKITWENIVDRCCWHVSYTKIQLHRNYIARLTEDKAMHTCNVTLHRKYVEKIREMIESKGYKKIGTYTYGKY